ncbi:hypothetical protein [Cellulomonas sp. ICMP 17802]|uniref:hypothetical protein n=1 Tax=Cellulomonas sp. ICMP 17802 TaxID=3239199 RepID=UPI00351BAEB0
MTAFEGEQAVRALRAKAGTPEALLREYQRAVICNTSSAELTTPLNGACPAAEGDTGLNNCGTETPVLPLWTRTRATPTDAWSAWTIVADGGCPADLLPTMSAADFRRLPIAPQVIQVQPDRGWVLVNKETIVLTDPAEQTFRTDLLGYGVDVVATPTRYTWDFADGTRDLSTTSPGHPYPGFDVFHVYARPAQGVAITLTTQWSGRYRVDGDDEWRDIVGTAETTSSSAPFEVVERRSHLVSQDCNQDPDQPGCG